MPYPETADWSLIPEHCRDGLRRYIDDGIPAGSFMTAVLENNLKQSVLKADDINIRNIVDYVKFLYLHAPSSCWGSPERVQNWIEMGGRNGGSVKAREG